MAWVVLFVAGLLEIGWAVGLKYTEGFTRLWPTVGTVVALIASMALLGVALRTLPLGTAYAVWTGIGTVGTAVLGIVLFREPATAMRLLCIASSGLSRAHCASVNSSRLHPDCYPFAGFAHTP